MKKKEGVVKKFFKGLGKSIGWLLVAVVAAFMVTTFVAAIMASVHNTTVAGEINSWNNFITTIYKFLRIVKPIA